LCVAANVLQAQTRAPDSLQVFLMTFGQGQAVWEKFGHNAIWFYAPADSVDVAYNWGTFDFDQPHFLKRFLIGDTRYWVVGYPGTWLLDYYRNADRSIVLQQLRLTDAQARRAYAYAQWNARDENKYYRYDYYRDNCSTRVRDLIDYALGGQLRPAMQDTTRVTYRSETLRLVDDMKFTQLGIDAALGEPADRRLTVWQDAFVPMRLRDALRAVRVRGPSGSAPVPLVGRDLTMNETRTFHERSNAPSLALPYLLAGLLFGAELGALAWTGWGRGERRSRAAQRGFLVEAGIWSFVAGLGGVVLLLAWLLTKHVFWYRNENLLLLNPLSLWLCMLIPWSAARPRYRRAAAITAVIVALLAALALVIKIIPGSQQNAPLALLIVPLHFAVAFGLRERAATADTSHAALDRS
jgi:Domain of unknown function (DUF4105)